MTQQEVERHQGSRLPASTTDLQRRTKRPRMTLFQAVENEWDAAYNQDEGFRSLLEAVVRGDSPNRSLEVDDVKAAEILQERVMNRNEVSNPIYEAAVGDVLSSMRRVLTSWGVSRAQRKANPISFNGNAIEDGDLEHAEVVED